MKKKGDKSRRCASIVLLRSFPGSARVQVLLVHKPRKKDAWQIPQGGAEDEESIEEAAIRELREETGVTGKVFGKSKRRYQYDFPASYRRFRPDNVCGQCIQFVFAQADPSQEVRVDGKEINSFAWVFPEQLSRYIHREEYREIVAGLVEEGMAVLQREN